MSIDIRGMTVRVLTEYDVMSGTDLCRPLHDIDKWTEELPKSVWRPVSDELPAWVGKPLMDLHLFGLKDTAYDRKYYHMYEVVRVLI